MRYLLDVDPNRTRNVHQDPHLVTGSPEVLAWWGTDVLSAEEGRPIGRELDTAMRVHRTKVKDGATWHCSLSLRADESILSDEQWGKIAAEFVHGMGFDGPDVDSPCKWVAVRHGLSKGRDGRPGNDHVHLAVNLVHEDGRPADVFRDYIRAQQLCRELERKHGLRPVAERGRATRGLSRAELSRREARRATEPERRFLERAVRSVAAQSATEQEFVAGLRSEGLSPRPWYAKGSGTSIVGGYSVQAKGSPIRLAGTHLAKDLSLPRLRSAHGWVPGAESVEAWRSQRAWRPRRGVQPTPEAWARGTEEVARLRQWLGGIPLEDSKTWTLAAHELAGVFAAGALAREREGPGALAEAADALAKSSQVRGDATVPRPVGMPDTRGAALLAASVVRGGQGGVAEAAFWKQLRNTVRAVHDAHLAVKDSYRAAEIAAVMKGRLVEVTRGSEQQAVGRVVERPRVVPGVERERGRGR